jgi:hypothetical protein
MEHVLWLGGPPASGKTTIATRLASRYGLRLYSADTRTWLHRDRALAAGNAAAARWESLTPAERWAGPPEEMLEMSLHHERGAMVIDDLAALPGSPLIIAEGSVLPDWGISTGAVDRSRAAWLLPTAEFQQYHLAARGTPDGPASLYRLLAGVIEVEAHEHGVQTITVDRSRDIEAVYAEVEELFSAALAAGPCADSQEERQRLLREINEDLIGQVRGYYERPWASGDPGEVTKEFVCECGAPDCTATLQLTVARAASAPVLAEGPAHTILRGGPPVG